MQEADIVEYDHEGRPTRKSLHMYTAFMWSRRSEDPRLQVGAVITSSNLRHILSFGYNGVAAGLPRDFIKSEPGQSGCLHAEENAILSLTDVPTNVTEATLFVTDMPCPMCAQRIINARGGGFITKVIYSRPYRNQSGIRLLEIRGVEVERFVPNPSVNLEDALETITTRRNEEGQSDQFTGWRERLSRLTPKQPG